MAPPPSPRPTILVVEDEWLIAEMIGHILAQAGFDTRGPAATVAQALALIEPAGGAQDACDAALLDVNLGPEKSYPVIDRLIALGIPHLLITGYNTGDLPERYRATPHVAKPLIASALVAAVGALVTRQPAE